MMRGLNVGSGQRRFQSNAEIEWINVDKVSRPGHEPDLVCDGATLPYADASVDYFVLHHVLEHFGCGEGRMLLLEAWRVLRPGGNLLVFVPDMQALSERWLAGALDTQVYLTNVYGAYMGDEEDRHRWGFTSGSLGLFLVECASWQSVKPFDWRAITGSDIARDWWILAMELVR